MAIPILFYLLCSSSGKPPSSSSVQALSWLKKRWKETEGKSRLLALLKSCAKWNRKLNTNIAPDKDSKKECLFSVGTDEVCRWEWAWGQSIE